MAIVGNETLTERLFSLLLVPTWEISNEFVLYSMGMFVGLTIASLLVSYGIYGRGDAQLKVSIINTCSPNGYCMQKYVVALKTSPLIGSGLPPTADVSLSLAGHEGRSPFTLLTKTDISRQVFSRGSTNVFLVLLERPLGEVTGVVLKIRSKFERLLQWRLNDVVVHDPASLFHAEFNIPSNEVLCCKPMQETTVSLTSSVGRNSPFMWILAETLMVRHLWLGTMSPSFESIFTSRWRIFLCALLISYMFTAHLIAYLVNRILSRPIPDPYGIMPIPLALPLSIFLFVIIVVFEVLLKNINPSKKRIVREGDASKSLPHAFLDLYAGSSPESPITNLQTQDDGSDKIKYSAQNLSSKTTMENFPLSTFHVSYAASRNYANVNQNANNSIVHFEPVAPVPRSKFLTQQQFANFRKAVAGIPKHRADIEPGLYTMKAIVQSIESGKGVPGLIKEMQHFDELLFLRKETEKLDDCSQTDLDMSRKNMRASYPSLRQVTTKMSVASLERIMEKNNNAQSGGVQASMSFQSLYSRALDEMPNDALMHPRVKKLKRITKPSPHTDTASTHSHLTHGSESESSGSTSSESGQVQSIGMSTVQSMSPRETDSNTSTADYASLRLAKYANEAAINVMQYKQDVFARNLNEDVRNGGTIADFAELLVKTASKLHKMIGNTEQKTRMKEALISSVFNFVQFRYDNKRTHTQRLNGQHVSLLKEHGQKVDKMVGDVMAINVYSKFLNSVDEHLYSMSFSVFKFLHGLICQSENDMEDVDDKASDFAYMLERVDPLDVQIASPLLPTGKIPPNAGDLKDKVMQTLLMLFLRGLAQGLIYYLFLRLSERMPIIELNAVIIAVFEGHHENYKEVRSVLEIPDIFYRVLSGLLTVGSRQFRMDEADYNITDRLYDMFAGSLTNVVVGSASRGYAYRNCLDRTVQDLCSQAIADALLEANLEESMENLCQWTLESACEEAVWELTDNRCVFHRASIGTAVLSSVDQCFGRLQNTHAKAWVKESVKLSTQHMRQQKIWTVDTPNRYQAKNILSQFINDNIIERRMVKIADVDPPKIACTPKEPIVVKKPLVVTQRFKRRKERRPPPPITRQPPVITMKFTPIDIPNFLPCDPNRLTKLTMTIDMNKTYNNSNIDSLSQKMKANAIDNSEIVTQRTLRRLERTLEVKLQDANASMAKRFSKYIYREIMDEANRLDARPIGVFKKVYLSSYILAIADRLCEETVDDGDLILNDILMHEADQDSADIAQKPSTVEKRKHRKDVTRQVKAYENAGIGLWNGHDQEAEAEILYELVDDVQLFRQFVSEFKQDEDRRMRDRRTLERFRDHCNRDVKEQVQQVVDAVEETSRIYRPAELPRADAKQYCWMVNGEKSRRLYPQPLLKILRLLALLSLLVSVFYFVVKCMELRPDEAAVVFWQAATGIVQSMLIFEPIKCIILTCHEATMQWIPRRKWKKKFKTDNCDWDR